MGWLAGTDLMHGILRGNAPHPTTGRLCLSPGDARLAFAIKEVDPRIHFALAHGHHSRYTPYVDLDALQGTGVLMAHYHLWSPCVGALGGA